jgi:hypothetical protein
MDLFRILVTEEDVYAVEVKSNIETSSFYRSTTSFILIAFKQEKLSPKAILFV